MNKELLIKFLIALRNELKEHSEREDVPLSARYYQGKMDGYMVCVNLIKKGVTEKQYKEMFEKEEGGNKDETLWDVSTNRIKAS